MRGSSGRYGWLALWEGHHELRGVSPPEFSVFG
jgi:hypothetical protein